MKIMVRILKLGKIPAASEEAAKKIVHQSLGISIKNKIVQHHAC
jgi:hypothetical protein